MFASVHLPAMPDSPKRSHFFCSYFTFGTMYVEFCSRCLPFFIVMKFHLIAGAINVSFFSEIQCNDTYKVLRIARKSSY